jgi:hypothetical protein
VVPLLSLSLKTYFFRPKSKIFNKTLANIKNLRIFASTLLCLFVWVFRALPSDKGGRVFFMPKNLGGIAKMERFMPT